MSRRALLIAGALAIAAAAWILGEDGGPAGTAPFDPPPAASRRAGPIAAETDLEPAPGPAPIAASPLAPEGLALGIAAPARRVGPQLRVVDESDGRPVAGASVTVFDDTAWQSGAVTVAPPPRRLVTDERGEARLPPLVSGARLEAAKGDRLGSMTLALESLVPGEAAVLPIGPTTALPVLVLDAEGRPQPGVAIRLTPLPAMLPMLHPHRREARTDGEGRARFDLPPQVASVTAPPQQPQIFTLAALVGDVTLAAQPVLRFPAAGEAVTLELPPMTTLEVRVLGSDGRPHVGPVRGRVGLEESGGWQSSELVAGEEGMIRFPFAHAGRPLVARIEDTTERHAAIESKIGPFAAGIPAQEVLRFWTRRPRITAEIVNADGSPVAGGDAMVRLGLGRADGKAPRATIARPLIAPAPTDGRVALSLASPFEERVRLRFVVRITSEGRAPREAEALIDGPVVDDVDLGTLVLEPVPLLVGGSVRDADGRGLAGVRMLLGDLQKGSGFDSLMIDDGPHFFLVRTDADGRFALHGRSAGSFTVHASRQGLPPAACEGVEPGTSDLVITLAAPGAIAGRMLVPEQTGAVFVACESEGRSSLFDFAGETVRADGTFHFGGLPQGRYVIDVAVADGASAVRLEGIEVLAGEAARDPRLDPIDLRSIVRRVTVTVRDSEGRPLWAQVRPLRSDGETSRRQPQTVTTIAKTGIAVLALSRLPCELAVSASLHRTRRILASTESVEVTLPRALEVKVDVDHDGARLPDGFRLEVPIASPGAVGSWMVAPIPREGGTLVELYAPEPGRYEVQPYVERAADPNAAGDAPQRVERLAALPFDVRDVDGPQVVRLKIPAAALGEAIEKLRVR